MTMDNSITIRYDGTEEQRQLIESPQGTRLVFTIRDKEGKDVEGYETVLYKERVIHFKHVFRLHYTFIQP